MAPDNNGMLYIGSDIDETAVMGFTSPRGSTRLRKEPLDLAVLRAYAKEGFVDDSYLRKTIALYKKLRKGIATVAEATSEFYPMISEAKAGKSYKDAVDIVRSKVAPYMMLYPRMDYVLGAVRENPRQVAFFPVTFNWKETLEGVHERLPFSMPGVCNEQELDGDGKFVSGQFVQRVTGDKTIPYNEFVAKNNIPFSRTIGLGDSLQQDGWVSKTRFPHIFGNPADVRQVLGRESLIDQGDFREAFNGEIRKLLGELNGSA